VERVVRMVRMVRVVRMERMERMEYENGSVEEDLHAFFHCSPLFHEHDNMK